jgi:hypothetical protein
MTAPPPKTQPWHQLPEERAPAHQAFQCFLELGPARTVAEAARRLGKRQSLLWRWARRHQWRHRVWAHDVQEAQRSEAAVREQRGAALRQRLEEVDQMGRACLVYFRTMVRRDPETGEINFDAHFTPQVALRFLELALKAQGAFDKPAPEETPDEQPAADLFGLADAELAELIDLARERADEQDQRKDNGDESDQSSTDEEEDEQHQEPADEER